MIHKKEMLNRSLKNLGDSSRLLNVFMKAARGEKISYVALGGSITEGYHSTDKKNKCYAALVYHWLKEHFPMAEVEFHNAGIPATSSLTGSYRLQRDVIKYNPDLVTVEFAVNDYVRTMAVEDSYDYILHALLNAESKPAVIAFNMVCQDGGSAQGVHFPIAEYYDIPYISFADGFWPEIEANNLQWESFYCDNVHPNDMGHALAGDMLCNYLEQILSSDKSKERAVPDGMKNGQAAYPRRLYYFGELPVESYGVFKEGHSLADGFDSIWSTCENGDPLVMKLENVHRLFILTENTNSGFGGKAELNINGNTSVLDTDFAGGFGVMAKSEDVFESDQGQDITVTVSPKLEDGKSFGLIALLVS